MVDLVIPQVIYVFHKFCSFKVQILQVRRVVGFIALLQTVMNKNVAEERVSSQCFVKSSNLYIHILIRIAVAMHSLCLSWATMEVA